MCNVIIMRAKRINKSQRRASRMILISMLFVYLHVFTHTKKESLHEVNKNEKKYKHKNKNKNE